MRASACALTEPAMPRLPALLVLICLSFTGLAATCPSAASEISRQRAIDIARPHATFAIVSTEAVRTTEDGRAVWRVTMQGAPLAPGSPLRPTVIVFIDRQSGEVISIAKS